MDVLKEEDVLKPAPPNEDPDDWPCHVLREAVIYSQNEKSLVNLLEAELYGPFVVQGKLEVEKQYKSQLLRNPRGRIVEVSSDLFSIGDGPEGVTIWAGGSGGWFEIIPSPVYREEFENMAAAVKLYYSILDYITEAKQSRRNPLEIDKIFDAYSAKEHDSTLNREDVAELCRIHGVFLLSMMRRPAAAKEWKSTPIFKWLNQELPDIIPRLNSSSGPRSSQKAKEPQPGVSLSPSPEITGARTRSQQRGTAQMIVEKMEEARSQGRNEPQDMTITVLGRILYEDFNFQSVADARELIRLHGKSIIRLLSKEWAQSPLYGTLEALPTSPRKVASNSKFLSLKLEPRESGATLPIRQNQNISQSEEMEWDPPNERSSRRPLAKGNGKNLPTTAEREIDIDVRPRGSRKSGKGAGLRLATPGKHPRSDLSDDDEDNTMKSKRQRRNVINLDDDDEEDTPIEEPIGDQSGQDDDVEVDDGEEEAHQEEEVEPDDEDVDMEEQLQLSLDSVKMPSFEPSGPDGLWTCPKKGCKYFVHGVEDEDIQEQIRKHFLKHAENIKVQLARFKMVKQESRPYLPINHLLEKLRRLGEASRLQEEAEEEKIDGKPVPKPIKRKLLA